MKELLYMGKSKMYRLVSLQIMNVVNIGMDKDVSIDDIVIMGMAVINASQLFLSEKEISILQVELWNRLNLKSFEKLS
ncbi:hypothetical protein PQE68_gp012 [Bacillus phage vB_BanS_Sophrita]|uniref:Uncharacterized protein n=1 Tax=Bacillus phage vB_BanS_Sophrita TaxID=2894790 RepID=A0AAE8YTR6_9CAUD|nr:hypothetical protein PQE68_gp012 [Bacillus phage vB_BanS_Sophrita]UGO50603.1 hypothetical protein SOPHRITA_12 [Bacillus phage vB_BanS_Sophrita]